MRRGFSTFGQGCLVAALSLGASAPVLAGGPERQPESEVAPDEVAPDEVAPDEVAPAEAAPGSLGPPVLPRDVPEPLPPTDYGPVPMGADGANLMGADMPLRLETARGWRNAGIAGLSVGVVLIGGAIAIGSTNPTDPQAGNSGFASARDRAAWTMGLPGGLIAGGGLAMLTYGLISERRLRLSGRVDRQEASLRLAWRF